MGVFFAGLLVVGQFSFWGNYLPGYFGHRGMSLADLVTSFYIDVRGIYGSTLGVVVEFVVLFFVMGPLSIPAMKAGLVVK